MSRNFSFDIISGMMILWMVVYHAFQWGGLVTTPFFEFLMTFFFFFMAWFYFKAGFFFDKKKNLKEIFEKDLKKLIIPMLIWNFIGYFTLLPRLIYIENQPIWKVFVWPIYSIFSSGDTIGNPPLWFLLSLFLVRLLLFFILRLSIKKIILIFAFSIYLSVELSVLNSPLPLGLITIPIGTVFALSGFALKPLIRKSYLNGIAIYFILLLLFSSNCMMSYVDVHTNNLWYGSYLLYIFLSISIIYFLLVCISSFRFFFLEWVGSKSMYFLVLHWPIFTILKYVLNIFGLSGGVIFSSLILLISLGVCVFFSYHFSSNKLFFDGTLIYEKISLLLKRLCN